MTFPSKSLFKAGARAAGLVSCVEAMHGTSETGVQGQDVTIARHNQSELCKWIYDLNDFVWRIVE